MANAKKEDGSISELRGAVHELKQAVSYVKNHRDVWQMPQPSIALPAESTGWNFVTFEKYINQRFGDLSLQLRERYEAQQTGVTAALAAAEKAVNAALIAAEKAVDKAEGAQQLRNEAQNEFRKSLSDLSGLMWTTKEGQAAVDSLRREFAASTDNIDKKVTTIDKNKSEALEHVRKTIEDRVSILESSRIEATEQVRKALVAHISAVDTNKGEALEQVRKAMEGRLSIIETGFANIQGRIWAVSALFSIVALAISVGVKFLGK